MFVYQRNDYADYYKCILNVNFLIAWIDIYGQKIPLLPLGFHHSITIIPQVHLKLTRSHREGSVAAHFFHTRGLRHSLVKLEEPGGSFTISSIGSQ